MVTIKCIPILAFLLGFVTCQGETRAATEAYIFQWQAEETTKGGRTVGCGILVDGMIGTSLYVTANLTLFIEPAESTQFSVMTLLKITVAELALDQGFKMTPMRLHGGWIRTSSGTTVGKLRDIPTSPYYLGSLESGPGMDLFIELISGMLEDGVTIGFQLRPDGWDTTMRIPMPPPVDTIVKIQTCLQNFERSVKG